MQANMITYTKWTQAYSKSYVKKWNFNNNQFHSIRKSSHYVIHEKHDLSRNKWGSKCLKIHLKFENWRKMMFYWTKYHTLRKRVPQPQHLGGSCGHGNTELSFSPPTRLIATTKTIMRVTENEKERYQTQFGEGEGKCQGIPETRPRR